MKKATKAVKKTAKVMREFKSGTLHSGKGGKVSLVNKQLLLLFQRLVRQRRSNVIGSTQASRRI
jgi:hypothetical protein